MAKSKPEPELERLKPGPKPRGGETSTLFSLRLTDDERTRWRAAAEAVGQSLSEWLRAAAEAAIAAASKATKRKRT